MLYDIESADEAYKTVIAKAGTTVRDAVERRVIDDVSNGTAKYSGTKGSGIIDKETDAEGFFEYSTEYTVPADTDGDGMPDEWEKANNLNPDVADNNLTNAEGYTALEIYLDYLMNESLDNKFGGTGIVSSVVSTKASYNTLSHILSVGQEAVGATLEVYTTNGQLLNIRRIESTETSLANLPAGILLLRISGKAITPMIVKVNR
jgi:hypothetical protein